MFPPTGGHGGSEYGGHDFYEGGSDSRGAGRRKKGPGKFLLLVALVVLLVLWLASR